MKPYANIDDYIRRYGDVDDVEKLYEVMCDASRKVLAECRNHGKDPKRIDKDCLMQVVRDMTYRAMSIATEGDDRIPMGVTQFSQGVNGFTEQMTFNSSASSGYGDLYLTRSEKSLLGLNSMVFGVAKPRIKGGRHGHRK